MEAIQSLNNTLPILLLMLWISVLATSSQTTKTKIDTSTLPPPSTVTPTSVNVTTVEAVTFNTTTTSPSFNVTQPPKVSTSTFPPLVRNTSQCHHQERHKNATLPSSTNKDESKDNHQANASSTVPPSIIDSTTVIPEIIDRFASGHTSTFPPLVHVIKPSSSAAEDEQKKPATATLIKMGRCPWAILGCCTDNAGLKGTVENCLDYLGCPGPFWDKKPCDEVFVDVAIETAYQRYKSGKV